jgi:DNA-binding MarR family transcriptional regulator
MLTDTPNTAAQELTRRVAAVHAAYRRYIQNKLREHDIDLTYEMFQVLACLWKAEGVNQQEIANMTVKDKAGVTGLIDNLAKRNLVFRQEDAADRRNKLIFLTDEGRALRLAIMPFIEDMFDAAGRTLGAAELDHCSKVLQQVENNLKTPSTPA